jgi:hypothetical protein
MGTMTLKAKKMILNKYNDLFACKGDLIDLNVEHMEFTNIKYGNYATFEVLEPDANDFELVEGDVTMTFISKTAEPDNVKDPIDYDIALDKADKKMQEIEDAYDKVADTISDKEAWEEKITNAEIKFNDGSDYNIDYDKYDCTKDLELKPIKIDKETLDNFTKQYGDVIKKISDKWKAKRIEVVDPEYIGASSDAVNHPAHYTWLKDKCGVEPIEIIRHMDFSLANAFKYLLRAGYKRQEGMSMPDSIKQDLRKAIWYIEDKINNL